MKKFNLDRLCPDCGEWSLIEYDLTQWQCQNPDCKGIFDEKYLDESED